MSATLPTLPSAENARTLLVSGSAIWPTNVITFALGYWEVDRGGSVGRVRGPEVLPAFAFPKMINPGLVEAGGYLRFVG